MNGLFSNFGSVNGINAKSTVMSPILWMFGIGFTGTGLLYWITTEIIVLYAGLTFISIIMLVALGSYIYFSIQDPDRLQSEKFIERKMLLQQGKLGDDQTGLNRSNIVIDASCERAEDSNG
ncbi:TPA: hypothetical protein ACK3JW_001012 [Mannheimia haemolytica]